MAIPIFIYGIIRHLQDMTSKHLLVFYSINSEVWFNPYRDSQSSSMFGILILDTFGDYWERYWFHADGYLNNQYPASKI